MIPMPTLAKKFVIIENLNEEYNEKAVGPARESVELYRLLEW